MSFAHILEGEVRNPTWCLGKVGSPQPNDITCPTAYVDVVFGALDSALDAYDDRQAGLPPGKHSSRVAWKCDRILSVLNACLEELDPWNALNAPDGVFSEGSGRKTNLLHHGALDSVAENQTNRGSHIQSHSLVAPIPSTFHSSSVSLSPPPRLGGRFGLGRRFGENRTETEISSTMSFVMPVPAPASEGSLPGVWGFSGPVKGFPSSQTAPLSAPDVPAEQSPSLAVQWRALYASVQDAVLMYSAQFVSALADGNPPAADVMASLDEALQDLARDVYVTMDRMEERLSQRAALFPIRVFALSASLEIARCQRLFLKQQQQQQQQQQEEEEEQQLQKQGDQRAAGEVSGETTGDSAGGFTGAAEGSSGSFLVAASNLRDTPAPGAPARQPLDEDDLTVLEQLLEEAGDEVQGLFLDCRGSLYGLGVTHAPCLARLCLLGKALKAAAQGATEGGLTVVRDAQGEVGYLERGDAERGEDGEEGEGGEEDKGEGGKGGGLARNTFEFDTSKAVNGLTIELGARALEKDGDSNDDRDNDEEGEGEEEEEDEEDADTNESDNIEDDCIIWDDGLQDLRTLFPPERSPTHSRMPSSSSASSAARGAALTPRMKPASSLNSFFSDRSQESDAEKPNLSSDPCNLTADSEAGALGAGAGRGEAASEGGVELGSKPELGKGGGEVTGESGPNPEESPTASPSPSAAAAAAVAAKGPRLGARIFLERIRDYQWLAEWLGIDPDELLIHKVLSVVPVGMLLTDLGVPRSLESVLLESHRPLLLRVVLPGFREEVRRRLVGVGLGWTEGMILKTEVFEPKRSVAVFTTGASGGGGGAAAASAPGGAGTGAAGGGGTGGGTTAATAAAAAAAAAGAAGGGSGEAAAAAAQAGGKAGEKKPSHKRTKSADDMLELSPFVSHAVQESLTAGGGLAKQIPLEDILAATDSWSPERKLGEGAYGSVFKGIVGAGQGGAGELWAVKRAANVSGSHLEEFEKEVSFMSRMAHQHLVRLIGFWADCDERILIYEFMHNGTLASRIHRAALPPSPTGDAPKKAPPPPLTFDERVTIAVGAAEGLRYLHDFARPPVIHRDIKSENILLAKDLQAKVADFGLLKTSDQGGPGRHVQRTRLMGTPGYCDPEYSRTYVATPKSDVYSFGVVLLELVTGRRAILAEPGHKSGVGLGNVASLLQRSKRNVKGSNMEPGATTTLVQWAIPLITAGKLKAVVDPALENNYPPGAMKALAGVAAMCVQKSAAQRPSMAEVATRLSAIQHKVQDLHIQGEEPKYNFQPTIGTGATPAAASGTGAATTLPRSQTHPRPKSPAPVPPKKAGEKKAGGAAKGGKVRKEGGVDEGEVKGKTGGKGVIRAKSATQPYLGAKDAVEFSVQHVTGRYMATF
ncbi:hypothetical protein CLOP_g24796 [Closterium sp. NIES-67]|nr:hypothetical protein CLOP_g24796 [Closterium sp. NIES-67]